jgi:hypothetical protein
MPGVHRTLGAAPGMSQSLNPLLQGVACPVGGVAQVRRRLGKRGRLLASLDSDPNVAEITERFLPERPTSLYQRAKRLLLRFAPRRMACL